ncbi:MAG: HNH endonuclease [Clostridium butyricum]|uniref:HNH endonuclease n=1 Tax=Clostridium sp. HMSC19A10 TaxID=1581148 RepID=UPI0008A35091|nr:HNH endonuclease [Clostridium sp. HMSC19A10]MDU1339825.1 HNH endonuclease [Clostridium butyricum]OFS23010.1 hypothetical protein HMPREF3070_09665 [Clostridium sp. HMSC19A10]
MEYLTAKELQDKYNISKETLQGLERRGLPSIVSGRLKRYDLNKVKTCLSNLSEGILNLRIGNIYDNSSISKIFACGTQGGMRRSHTTNTLVIFSDHSHGLYDDIWKDNILYYTGMGTENHQKLEGTQNLTLFESRTSGIQVHLFETFIPGQHRYRGQVELVNAPYMDEQYDINKKLRKVWIFPVRLKVDNLVPETLVSISNDKNELQAQKMSLEELKNRAQNSKGASTRTTTSKTYTRDQYVSEYVKRRAKGFCDLCNKPAPFIDKKSRPYLETHHVTALSEGGEDNINSCLALCPTCHRKVHILKSPEDLTLLKERLKFYIKNNK